MRFVPLRQRPDLIPFLADRCVAEWRHLYVGWNEPEALVEFSTESPDGRVPTTLLAFEGDELLGCASAIFGDLAGAEDLQPWVANLLVLPAHRGRGVGSALVAAVVELIRAAGHPAAYTFTESARTFFERSGFKPLRRATANGVPVDVLWLDLAQTTATPAGAVG